MDRALEHVAAQLVALTEERDTLRAALASATARSESQSLRIESLETGTTRRASAVVWRARWTRFSSVRAGCGRATGPDAAAARACGADRAGDDPAAAARAPGALQ